MAEEKAIKVYDNLTKDPKTEIDQDNLLWYICGPTVYDSSHLGHARTYLTSDILRRILQDYFHKDITYIMNITNVDDKIIQRAQEEKRNFLELANHYEQAFFRDLNSLNILPPDITTRVTDYLPEMIEFIETILENGHAYVSNGSVYYDMTRYEKENPDDPPPFAPNNQTPPTKKSEKRNPKDFALWKVTPPSAPPDEPDWDSPWSRGRPGWHLECSTMSINVSEELDRAGQIDIHSGGIDLAFPHHQNEILQSESYLGEAYSWRPIFLHIGHLNILGLKMSKSLKNFITIENFLKKHDADTLRMLFLMHQYQKPMDFDPEKSLEYAESSKTRIVNYFKFLENFYLRYPALVPQEKFQPGNFGIVLLIDFPRIQYIFDQALRNNFNTPLAMEQILKLIDQMYQYLNLTQKKDNETPQYYLVKRISDWILNMYLMFGFNHPTNSTSTSNNQNDQSSEYLNLIIKIRDQIREAAKKHKLPELFQLSDQIRDQDLPALGINLQDLD